MTNQVHGNVMATTRRWVRLEQLTCEVPLKRSRIYYLKLTNQFPPGSVSRIGRTLFFDANRILLWLEENSNGAE